MAWVDREGPGVDAAVICTLGTFCGRARAIIELGHGLRRRPCAILQPSGSIFVLGWQNAWNYFLAGRLAPCHAVTSTPECLP